MWLGLDISTAIIGWSIIDKSGNVLKYGKIMLKKLKSADFFDKIEYAEGEVRKILNENKGLISKVVVEEALQKFTGGKSTAGSINKLIAFNRTLSYLIYRELGIKPTDLNVRTARSKLGIKIPRGLKDKDKKEFVRSKCETMFPSVIWDKTRNETYKDYCFDIADSLVIAEAARIIYGQSTDTKTGS